MTAETLTLTDFLLARIAEDEAVAKACLEAVGTWRAGDAYDDGSGLAERDAFPSYPWGSNEAELAYMKAYHPARVLAECAAKRAIVETIHPAAYATADAAEATGERWEYFSCDEWYIDRRTYRQHQQVLLALASVYADRPGFREEWRA